MSGGQVTGITITSPGQFQTGDTFSFTLAGGGYTTAATPQNYTTTGTNDAVANGTGGLTKIGSGTLNLTGSSSYTGATLVSVGTLRANNGAGNGSATGTGANANVTVAGGTANYGGAELGGNGAVAGSVTLAGGTTTTATQGGLITAGASTSTATGIGTLSTGAQVWNGGSAYQWKIRNQRRILGGRH